MPTLTRDDRRMTLHEGHNAEMRPVRARPVANLAAYLKCFLSGKGGFTSLPQRLPFARRDAG